MAISDMLVTLPGTNTAEAMYMGLPMLVLMPLNRPDLIHFDGLFGLIGNAPLIGKWIKTMVVHILKKKKRYYSLANSNANKMIVKEVIGIIKPTSLAHDILAIYNTPSALTKMKKELARFKPKKSVAEHIVHTILSR